MPWPTRGYPRIAAKLVVGGWWVRNRAPIGRQVPST